MTFWICDAHPGPGYWRRDNSHFPIPVSRHFWELFMPPYDEGTRRGFARYGCVIDHFDIALIKGRLFSQTHFVDEPEELDRRGRVAGQALATKLWRQDRIGWPALRDDFRNRLLDSARQDPCRMDSRALLRHLVVLRRMFAEGTIRHFAQQPASMFPVGDWIRRACQWTGASPSEAVAVLQGSCPGSADCLEALDKLLNVLRSHPEAVAIVQEAAEDARTQLERILQVSPQVAELLDSYLDEYADRVITGFDIADTTLRELPQFILAILASRLRARGELSDSARRGADAEIRFRERVPAENRSEFDEALAEAKAGYGLHDEDIRILYLWPLGLIRRALLAAANRLAARGALHSGEDVFETTPDELDCLLDGESRPSADELARRADQRRLWTQAETPAVFGEKELSPPPQLLSSACARVSSSIMFYLGVMEDHPAQTAAQPSWSVLVDGLAASPGSYEGRARIVREPKDFARLAPGDVLVARTTSPAYNTILPIIGAVVTERGGALCHAAIIAREFGIPAVVGTCRATTRIPDGARVLVDGDRGFVAVRV